MCSEMFKWGIKKRLKYDKIYQDRVLEKMLEKPVKSRKIEVILRYAKKNKSAHGLPRQETNFLLKVLYLLGFEQYSIGF